MKLTPKQRKFADNYIKSRNAYGVVYCITNNTNNKQYVGVTTRSIEQRFKEHCKTDSGIGKAIKKYGKNNFDIELIDYADDKEELYESEIYWINKLNTFKNGYNQTLGGEGVINYTKLEIHLNTKQQRFIKYTTTKNSQPIDIYNHSDMVDSLLLNMIQLYLTADTRVDKKKAAKLLNKLNNEYKRQIAKTNLIDINELLEYVA